MTNTILTRRSVFAGRIFSVAIETHRLPDDRTADFEVVRHPGGAAVLPVLDDGRLLLMRQFRPAIGACIYEIPAGRLEPGESAAACAERELQEEAGYRASLLEDLGGMYSAVGYCDEYVALFLARQLQVVRRSPEPDEFLEPCPITLDRAIDLLRDGEITDSKTQVALLRYRLLVGEEIP